ncbi:Mu transposase C-terminal domain-containing protein [Ectopseudomonas hydrolytica]|uniref:Mu transposase C-terminal domain-containing protein n=1 Tax=Ectopseudomonas hydrolytica TaxID=2493633 RepID=A0ABY5A885_9GAMM|nr:Mu transposase C-terminal domain-containing protein [Pseudomonas hydrolytica]USR39873.1 Mu transposase C-terminal domain-containing protein [Pseudomonas hydrolytica]
MSEGLKVGMVTKINGDLFVIDEILLSINTVRLVGSGGARLEIDCDKFYEKFSSGEFVLNKEFEVAKYSVDSDAAREETQFRMELVDLYKDHLEKCSKKTDVERDISIFCFKRGHKPVRLRTVREYYKKYADGNYAALVPNYGGRGGCGWSSKKEYVEFVKQKAIEIYFADDKVNKRGFYKQVDELLRQKLGDQAPEIIISESTCSRTLEGLPVRSALNGRLSKKELNLEERRAIKKYRDCRVFAVVELDACTIDVMSVDEHGRKHTEVTLYLMRDVRTSYPVAVYVMAGKPSEMGLYKILEQFYKPRDEAYYKSLGVNGVNIVSAAHIGVLVIDNASEHFGKLVWEVIRRLGVIVKNTRQYRGDDKGYVESGFSILNKRLLGFMPGAKKSNDKRVKNRMAKADEEACYSVEYIFKEIVEFFYGTYIHELRPDLGFIYGKPMTIAQAMEKELSLFKPLPPPSLDKFKKLIVTMHCEERKYQHYGVDFKNFQFNSTELARYMDKSGEKSVLVYFNPADCTKIYVAKKSDREGTLIEAQNKMLGIPEISFEEASSLLAEYSGDHIMTGKEFQRIYARKLMKFTEDSRRKPKVKDVNKSVRNNTKKEFNQEVGKALSKDAVKPKQVTFSEASHDDDITPSEWSSGHD